MKRTGLFFFLLSVVMISVLAQSTEKKEITGEDLMKERALMAAEKEEIKRERDDLKSFQLELEQRALDLEKLKKEIDEQEKVFQQRLQSESVNKQTIESYQSIDPEQAAPLIIALFKEDETLTALLMRKMDSKKAGKIMEAMIPVDPDISTRLAYKALTFYSEKKD